MKSVSYQPTLSETRGHLVFKLFALRADAKWNSCYVSGPMTGLPDYNVHSFKEASRLLRNAGWDVRSPHENDADQGIILEGKTGDEVWQETLSEFDYAKAMSWDLQQVCLTDCTIVLPGWEYSSGALLEVYVALAVGKPVYTLLSQRQITEVPEMEKGFSSRPLSEGEVRGTNRDTDSFPTPGPVSLSESVFDKPGSAEEDSSPSSRRAGKGEGAVRAASSPTSRHPNSARFHELVQEIGDLHDKKQQDYGSDTDPFANVRASEEWGVPSWVGALVRLNDKVTRLKSFARKGSLANESAEDSMRDIAVYALIALVLYEQESA